MRECPSCKENTSRLKNIFSLRYKCESCGSVSTSSTGHKAFANILINVLPIFGVILTAVFKSVVVFLLFAVILPLLLSWWHQRIAVLHVVSNSGKVN